MNSTDVSTAAIPPHTSLLTNDAFFCRLNHITLDPCSLAALILYHFVSYWIVTLLHHPVPAV